jgi:hypothetical protein
MHYDERQWFVTQAEIITFETTLRYLVIAGQVPYSMYVELVDQINLQELGRLSQFGGEPYGKVRIEHSQEEKDLLEYRKN